VEQVEYANVLGSIKFPDGLLRRFDEREWNDGRFGVELGQLKRLVDDALRELREQEAARDSK
jgi:hypothetical protein